MIFFAKLLLKMTWRQLTAPAAILFTLHTLTQGLSALILAFLSANLQLDSSGKAIQALVSFLFSLLFFLILVLLRKRYCKILSDPASSYLYILLLPCGFLILAIRCGLKLDSPIFADYLSSFEVEISLMALLLVLAAAALFFLSIEVFSKTLFLVRQEQDAALLSQQLEGQRRYIEEAKKRNQVYAAFQHDVDNHLLILSGLLEKERFSEARAYGEKLRKIYPSPDLSISTGNAALDVLLQEKLSYAGQNGIEAACRVVIPPAFHADDLDLCVIFSNILDNAICACMKEQQQSPFLSISAKVRSQLLFIESANTASNVSQPVKEGIGLNNIKNMAEKYQGTMEWEICDGVFRISVLLCSDLKLI